MAALHEHVARGESHQRHSPGCLPAHCCVGSKDIGLATVVAAARRGKFWQEMAIFVIKDDTPHGPDHVETHPTTDFVLSPRAMRGVVDSPLYPTVSMIRPMEPILGFPPLTHYDAAATPQFNCFQREAARPPPMCARRRWIGSKKRSPRSGGNHPG